MTNGWIHLHRKIVEWEWYQDSETVHLFLHLLLNANWKDTRYKGIAIRRGQLMTGFRKLAEETGISIKKIRTRIKWLKWTRELAQDSTHLGTVITVCNYDKYNDPKLTTGTREGTQEGTERAHKGHDKKKDKKDKKDIPIGISNKAENSAEFSAVHETDADFEEWWRKWRQVATRRPGRKKLAGMKYARLRKKYSSEQVNAATRHYILECRRDRINTRDAERFLVCDLIEQYQALPEDAAAHNPDQFNAEERGWKSPEQHYTKTDNAEQARRIKSLLN